MLYAILCYAHEETVFAWTKEEEAAVMEKLHAVQEPLAASGKLGPVGRLMPTSSTGRSRKRKRRFSASTWWISIRSTRQSPSRNSYPPSIPAPPLTKFGLSTCSGREMLHHD